MPQHLLTERPARSVHASCETKLCATCRESFSKVWILPQGLHMFVVPRRAPRPAADGTRSHMRNTQSSRT